MISPRGDVPKEVSGDLFGRDVRDHRVEEPVAKLGMDTGTITPLLKRLEKAGFVTRRRDAADERRVLVDLTKTGLALRDPAWRIPGHIKSACQLTDDGLASLRDTLDGLARPAED